MNRNTYFSDFLFLLFRWKKLVIINLIVAIAVSITISLLLPKTYKSTATVVIAPENSGGGMSGIANLLSGNNNLLSFGAKLLGGEGTQEDMLLGILNSRTVLSRTILRFDLFKYYKVKNVNLDLAMKKFKKDISFDPNEFGFIEVSVIHKNATESAEIANFLVHLADSIHIVLNIENARRNRLFIEKRYIRNLNELGAAEESMLQFQKEHGVFVIPEQIELALGAAGDLEVELMKNQILINTLEGQVSKQSASYQNIALRIQAIQEKLANIHTASQNNQSLFIPFDDMPFLEKEYLKRYREVEIQNKLLQFTYTYYEQAKMEEQKNIPTLMTIDPAIPPWLKHSPKRAAIVVGATFLVFIVSVLTCLRGQFVLTSEARNPVEKYEKSFFRNLLTLYSFDPR